jgi:Acetyltransferases
MIKEINIDNIKDVYKPSQSFRVIGRLSLSLQDGKWTSSEELYNEPYEKIYTDKDEESEENYAEYIENPDKTVFLYYGNQECVGRVRIRRNWNRYAFIEDIAVAESGRGKGIGSALIEKAIEWAKQKELYGLMLETQDVNLLACRFYRKTGFEIGAVDTMLYSNFDCKDEKAIFWYLRF